MKKFLATLGTAVGTTLGTTVTVGALAGALAGTALLTAPAGAATAASVTVRPESLDRGPDVRGAHLADLDSKTIVDGDVTVTVRGSNVGLLGTSGSSYVVSVLRGEVWSIVRVGPGGGERLVARNADAGDSVLASDGGLLAVTRSASATRTRIDLVRVSTGRTVLSRTFSGYQTVLDLRGSRAILGSDAGTYSWNVGTDKTSLLTRRVGAAADLRTGRLATYDGDPYDDGCSVITTIAQPRTTLWRSCGERVAAFSPDGKRIATIHILSDGPGPGQVRVRSTRGNLLATYNADGVFGAIRFESARSLLLATYGQRKAAEVRCTGGSCERASALTTSPPL